MKISNKLTLAFALVGLLVPLTVYSCLPIIERNMESKIRSDLEVLVRETLDKIDRLIWQRLEQVELFGREFASDMTLLEVNFQWDKKPNPDAWLAQVQSQWSPETLDPNGFLHDLRFNPLSQRLRLEMLQKDYYHKYGHEVFTNAILTNHYGALIGFCEIPDRFDYSQANWWPHSQRQGLAVEESIDRSTTLVNLTSKPHYAVWPPSPSGCWPLGIQSRRQHP